MTRELLDGRKVAVAKAIVEVSQYQTGSSVAEITDCAMDLLSDQTVYMTPDVLVEAEAEMVAEVLFIFGLDSRSSDTSFIPQERLVAQIQRDKFVWGEGDVS